MQVATIQQYNKFTRLVFGIFVVTLIAAFAVPLIVGISYESALLVSGSQKVLVGFTGWFAIWTALGLFWEVPPQYVAFPALSFLQLGCAIASWVAS